MKSKALVLSFLLLAACKGDSKESPSKGGAETPAKSTDPKPGAPSAGEATSACSAEVASFQSWIGGVGLGLGHDWSTQRKLPALVATPKGGPLDKLGPVITLSGTVTSVEGTTISDGPIEPAKLKKLLHDIDRIASEGNRDFGAPVIQAKVDANWANIVAVINVLKESSTPEVAFLFEAGYPASTKTAPPTSAIHDAIVAFGKAYSADDKLDPNAVGAPTAEMTSVASGDCAALKDHLQKGWAILPEKRMSHFGQKTLKIIEACDCAIDVSALKEFYWYFVLSRPFDRQKRFIVVSLADSREAIKLEAKADARWEEVAPDLLNSVFNDIPKPIAAGLIK